MKVQSIDSDGNLVPLSADTFKSITPWMDDCFASTSKERRMPVCFNFGVGVWTSITPPWITVTLLDFGGKRAGRWPRTVLICSGRRCTLQHPLHSQPQYPLSPRPVRQQVRRAPLTLFLVVPPLVPASKQLGKSRSQWQLRHCSRISHYFAVEADGEISWSSDGASQEKGWSICAGMLPTPVPTPSPSSHILVIQGICEIIGDCLQSVHPIMEPIRLVPLASLAMGRCLWMSSQLKTHSTTWGSMATNTRC